MNTKAMNKIGYGLYVLSTRENGKDNACIVNTVMQVTTSPNRITVAVNKENYTAGMISRTGVFNVSMLTDTVPFSVFQTFGFQSGKTADKFAAYEGETARAENGLLYLKDNVNAFISAKVISETDLGTHILFLADVTDCEVLGDGESLTYAEYHRSVKPAAKQEKKKGFRCRICGYIYEGDTLPPDFICPICKHGAEDFEPIE